ncbi:MAG: methyl-accepting chemotaxis protein [Pseudomonadota bacterium]|nr:methyl-accepting chemotaxis protein [Pseudomonadota bacterium]
MQLTIRARLFSLAVLTLVAMLALGLSSFRGMTEAVDGLVSVFATSRALRNHLEGDMMHDALRADVLSALLAQTPEERHSVNASLREHADHFRKMIAENDRHVTDPELQSSLRAVGPVLESYILSAEAVVSAAQTDVGMARSMLPAFVATFEELEGRLAAISDRIQESAAAAEVAAQSATTAARWREVGILALMLIITIAVATWIVRGINRGISRLVDTITQIQRTRDLSKRVEVSSRDELGQLAECFNALVVELQGIISEVNRGAADIDGGAEQMSSSSRVMASGAAEQAESLGRITSSLATLSDLTDQTTQITGRANSLSADSQQAADRVAAELETMSTAMAEIRTASAEVGKVNRAVDEIAFQINLLSLNAAVEAARAGEAGRGFAVVAEEVRSLAQRSAKAAKETSALIESAMHRAERGVQIAGSVGEALGNIAVVTTQMNDMLREIAKAANSQAKGVADIRGGIGALEKVSRQAAANAETLAGASEQTAVQVRVMGELVGRFKL